MGITPREIAQILDSTEESVTSALKRARATLQLRLPPSGHRDQPPPPRSAAERDLVERFTHAFESNDLDGVVGLLTEDVWFTMPPLPFEWQGPDRALQFLRAVTVGPGRRLIATRANGQPAFGLYLPDPHAQYSMLGDCWCSRWRETESQPLRALTTACCRTLGYPEPCRPNLIRSTRMRVDRSRMCGVSV